MNGSAKNAAMLWTGGKDSALALAEAQRVGCVVRCLVTFVPPEPRFLAHPIAFMELQARALGLPHVRLNVSKPFRDGYENALRKLKDAQGINTVITGDIAEVDGLPNWIRERSRAVGLEVLTPLWGRDRSELLQQLLARRFRVLFSLVKTRWLSPDWVGRELDAAAVADLRALRERNGLDLCGENGEYHTLVTDGPQFKQRIRVGAFATRVENAQAHIDIHEMGLVAA
jgi:uncharacterized protein (TIGR00290 family)